MPSTAPERMTARADYSDFLHVVVAIVENGSGEVLISRRPDHLHQGGRWEFPGGKLEAGETPWAALQRELLEEVAITPVHAHPLIRIPYHYPERKVLIEAWRVTQFSGEPYGAEGQSLQWVSMGGLNDFDFPPANLQIITAAQLPSCYLITPDPGGEHAWPDFLKQLRRSLQAGITLVQLRATSLGEVEYQRLACQVLDCCEAHGARLMLNAGLTSFASCHAAGLHLTSRRLMELQQRPVGAEKLLAASCHSLEEVLHAQRIGADFVLLSPIKETASHPGESGIGWHALQGVAEQVSVPIYALGGMTPQDLPDAWRYGAQGIAAIRSLWDGTDTCPA